MTTPQDFVLRPHHIEKLDELVALFNEDDTLYGEKCDWGRDGAVYVALCSQIDVLKDRITRRRRELAAREAIATDQPATTQETSIDSASSSGRDAGDGVLAGS